MIPDKLPPFVKYGKLLPLASPADIRSFSKNTFEVFEKIDGGNCQIRKVGPWQLMGGTKANYLTGKSLEKREWFKKFNRWIHSNHSLQNIPENLVVFGEWSGNHTIEYLPENTDRFFVLDVFDLDQQKFIPYSESKKTLEELSVKDVQFLNPLANGKISPIELHRLIHKGSDFYNGPLEGVVLKDYNDQEAPFLKTYHPDFSEKQIAADGSIVYLTPARYRKNIFNLAEDIHKRPLATEEIVQRVQDDILTEEGISLPRGIISSNLHTYSSQGKLYRAGKLLGNHK